MTRPAGGSSGRSSVFDEVADDYDTYRPEYPDTLYDAIEAYAGALDGRRVLDLGGGTGIATRALLARGADVIAADLGADMLRVLRRRSPRVPVVRARGEELPFADGSVDLLTCATAWHWMRLEQAAPEALRVLRPRGVLAVWWGFAAALAERDSDAAARERAVFDRWHVWEREPKTPGPAGDPRLDLRRHGFSRVVVRNRDAERTLSAEEHIRHLQTHSLVIDLGDDRAAFIRELTEALSGCGRVSERVSCHLVMARRPG